VVAGLGILIFWVSAGMASRPAAYAAVGHTAGISRSAPATDPTPSVDTTPGATAEAIVPPVPVRKFVLKIGKEDRLFYLHIPPKYRAAKPMPLMVLLHGRGGNPLEILGYTRMGQEADRAGFIVACPAAAPETVGDLPAWRVGFNSGMKDPSDVTFLVKLLAKVEHTLSVDKTRVFIVGHSSGAMMACRFASEHSELVSGIGIVAFTVGARDADGTMVQLKAPAHPVSVIAFHGTRDPTMPFGPDDHFAYNSNFIPATAAVDFWAASDECARPSARKTVGDGHVIEDRYSGGKDGTEVVFYAVLGGDHWWPGDQLDAVFVAPEDEVIDASSLIVQFLMSHPRANLG
jgi:polyhydroxybutyrate depolymerase